MTVHPNVVESVEVPDAAFLIHLTTDAPATAANDDPDTWVSTDNGDPMKLLNPGIGR